jgi:hypothetical protein
LRLHPVIVPLFGLLLLLTPARKAQAQLISPGELIEAHAEWDRLTTCTSCHALGSRGVEDTRCLSCHTPLQDRIAAGLGLHATFDEPSCATCHKDHFGRDFDPIRFDTMSFDHDLTGFALIKSHTEATCASCHTPDFVVDDGLVHYLASHSLQPGDGYLGLGDTCVTCHAQDNAHADQFADVACSTCHDSGEWEEAPEFDHDMARYKLTGEHLNVDCASCHESSSQDPDLIVYRPLPFSECSSCHEDAHDGRLGPTCSSCHATSGWTDLAGAGFEDDFDHDLTGFELVGQHERAACASCHNAGMDIPGVQLAFLPSTRDRSYPHPVAEVCASCHEDAHDGQLETEQDCASCHSEEGWTPSSFDVFRHAEETDYPLEGAHLAVLCSQCHSQIRDDVVTDPYWRNIDLSVDDPTCIGCHTEDDPHDGQFAGEACESCHTVTAWLSAADTFDHATTQFPLDGAHALETCASCHKADPGPAIAFRGVNTECATCHEDDSPHAGQFEPDGCQTCHDTASFRLTAFDHEQTGWSLTGAHTNVACLSCHTPTKTEEGLELIRFRGIGTECIDCHGGNIGND